MAWIESEQRFMGREERQGRIDAYRRILRDTPNDVTALPDDLQVEIAALLDELERLERVHLSETNLVYLALCYFSERFNPDNAGNWEDFDLLSADHAPQFHREISAIIDNVSNHDKAAKVAVAAPRGHAKSSYLSKANPLREIVFRKRKYIIIISETPNVATANLEWLATQLKSNEKLRRDFGPLLSGKQQMNPKDNSTEFIAWEPRGDGQKQLTLVQAASTGQALRGRNWNGSRPDMVICDDLEDLKSNAATKELRDKLKSWFSSVVMPLGDPKGRRTAFIYMGTIVHADSLLYNVIRENPEFKATLYRALIEEPERIDLWEECRSIYLDVEIPKDERLPRAKAFYEANKDEMDRGAVVLWPEAQPVWRLMTWKWTNGSKAFNTEYQNNPIDEESAIFKVEQFLYYAPIDVDASECDFFGAWDIAFGKSARADYNAIATIGRHRKTGALYVWDVWMAKCPAHEALEIAVQKILEYRHRGFVVETIGGQYDLYRQLKERLQRQGIYRAGLKEITTKRKKEERIESLEPLCENGTLRFRREHRLLLEMFEQYPNHNHDDGPDALSYAVDIAGNAPKRLLKKPAYL